MKILLVEDNAIITKGLIYNLNINNYDVISKESISGVKELFETNCNFDIAILDINLKDGNGFDLYENIIKEKNIPTIFLTALDLEDSIVKGLELGAYDYITKPFSTKELLARVNRILLRVKKEEIIKIKDIKYDYNKMIVYKNNKEIQFTALELKLINLLFNNLNKVVTRDDILYKIWEWTGNDVDNHTITVYFQRIRIKLETDIIKTIKGIGYRIDEK